MRYFTIIDFQDMVLALFLGLGVLILIYLSWSGYSREKDEKELDREDVKQHPERAAQPVMRSAGGTIRIAKPATSR